MPTHRVVPSVISPHHPPTFENYIFLLSRQPTSVPLTQDKPYFSLNGALMHFRKHSPYLCEAFHIMATSPLPQPNTFTWGSHLYAKLHRRLLSARQKPFSVLPWCFADPRNCRSDIRFPDPFSADPPLWAGRRWDGSGEIGRSGRELLEEKVGYVWTVHLHNQWRKEFPKGGWVDRLLEGYKGQIDAMERYIRSRGGQMGHGYTVRSFDEGDQERGHEGQRQVAGDVGVEESTTEEGGVGEGAVGEAEDVQVSG